MSSINRNDPSSVQWSGSSLIKNSKKLNEEVRDSGELLTQDSSHEVTDITKEVRQEGNIQEGRNKDSSSKFGYVVGLAAIITVLAVMATIVAVKYTGDL